jgi:hypothetical protein
LIINILFSWIFDKLTTTGFTPILFLPIMNASILDNFLRMTVGAGQ